MTLVLVALAVEVDGYKVNELALMRLVYTTNKTLHFEKNKQKQ